MRPDDYEAFIFDLDGTIIDSERYHARAFADAVLQKSGYSLTPDEHLEFFGKHSTWFAAELNERYGLSMDPEEVLARKRRRVNEIFVAKPFAGALEFLHFWQGRKPMALATNSPLGFVRPALEESGMLHFFDGITTSDEVTHRKPHPEIFELTVQKLRSDPLKTLVFEDQLIGIQAARSAGTRVVAVDNGQAVDFPPDVEVLTWNELMNGSRNI